jgi:Ca-activated chloride channel family protein
VSVRSLGLVLVLITWATHAFAQAVAPPDSGVGQSASIFRGGVDLVSLNVVVTDDEQKFVTGLSVDDFAVYEDGVQQDLSFFAASSVPIDLAILLDTSASMVDKMATVQEAAIGFASSLRPGDRLTVVDIKDTVKILHPLDGDAVAADAAIRGTTARGGTALYNDLYMTLKELMKPQRANGEIRRAAIVVLSDGDDTASLVSFDDVMDTAKRSGIAVYTITLQSPYRMRRARATGNRHFSESEFAMRSLAQETGARSFVPSSVSELAGVYGLIADELANQYALGYTSKNRRADGAYRRVVVRVAEPGTRTRTRSGYVASSIMFK